MKSRFVILMVVMAAFLILMTQCSPATTVVPTSPAANDTPAPTGLDGQALAQKACTACHGFDKATNQKRSAAQWKSMVQRMVDLGAQLNPDEQQAVIDYLAKNYGR